MPTKTVNVVLDALGLAAISASGFVLWLWLGLVLTGLPCWC